MIQFVAVDNCKVELDALSGQLNDAFPKCVVTLFTNPLMSAKYICNNAVDVVFIADVMRPVDGFTLMKVLRTQKPNLPVVVLSSSEACREHAKQLAADYCFIKPVTSLQVSELVNFFR